MEFPCGCPSQGVEDLSLLSGNDVQSSIHQTDAIMQQLSIRFASFHKLGELVGMDLREETSLKSGYRFHPIVLAIVVAVGT